MQSPFCDDEWIITEREEVCQSSNRELCTFLSHFFHKTKEIFTFGARKVDRAGAVAYNDPAGCFLQEMNRRE